MKVLIIYYSQSGNTLLIARHIEKACEKQARTSPL